ncbi:hypothetical protein LRS12_00845 [Sphingomonas sp. J344]|uniref:hypothetical protein n=1 Tax=Sphingomonas sp. J344 TaxID=2898434 RepID=UPI00215070FC|nr:hypothetical protein [Sphingomonas sp. J344]MCR5869428.1 hypothetical protein [Sphingomonas sp. J344]
MAGGDQLGAFGGIGGRDGGFLLFRQFALIVVDEEFALLVAVEAGGGGKSVR